MCAEDAIPIWSGLCLAGACASYDDSGNLLICNNLGGCDEDASFLLLDAPALRAHSLKTAIATHCTAGLGPMRYALITGHAAMMVAGVKKDIAVAIVRTRSSLVLMEKPSWTGLAIRLRVSSTILFAATLASASETRRREQLAVFARRIFSKQTTVRASQWHAFSMERCVQIWALPDCRRGRI